MIENIFPKAIKEFNLAAKPKNLLKKQLLQIGLAETKVAKFSAGGHVILDFEKEMNGGVRILTFLATNVRTRIRFGESLTECCSNLGGEKNATNDHALRDFYVNLHDYSDMTFSNSGFRFVRLDFEGDISIKSVVAVNHILNKKTIYTYTGSDERIKQIFDVAKRTVDLCAGQEYLWDGVKRDRLVWIGDMHPEMLALVAMYGRLPVIEKSLDFIKKQTPLPRWMNNIPMYSMWWIIILADYYELVGAKAFVKKQLNYLVKLVEQLHSSVSEDGTLNYPFYFVDWPTSNQPDEKHGVRAINIFAMKKAIILLKEFSSGVFLNCSIKGKSVETVNNSPSVKNTF